MLMTIEKEKLFDEEEICNFLNISPSKLYRMRREGLPCIKIGKRTTRYDRYEVLDWIKKHYPQE